MKEDILKAFHELGFNLELLENLGYGFTYEGNNYIYLAFNDDDEFLSISVPGIYELNDDNLLNFVSLAEKLNSTPKYVKAYNVNNDLWLFYERELLGEKDLKLVISRMILHLDEAFRTARQYIAQMKAKADEETAEEVEEETTEETVKESDNTDDTDNNDKE